MSIVPASNCSWFENDGFYKKRNLFFGTPCTIGYKYLCTSMVSLSKPVPFKFKLNFKLRLEYICKNTESSWYWNQRNNLYWVDTQKLYHPQFSEYTFPPLPLYISLLNMENQWGSFIYSNSNGNRWNKLWLSCAKLASNFIWFR